MNITLIPQFGRPDTQITVAGDVITIDGVAYDLSPVPEGGEAWPQGAHPFIGPITRTGGVINATLLVHLGDAAADDQPGSPWVIEAASGEVPIPAARKPDPEA
jgi:hypothetical protein